MRTLLCTFSIVGTFSTSSWEVKYGRENYDQTKVDKIIELQRLRTMFEALTTCRLPWVEVGFELDWYPRYLKAATGLTLPMEDLYPVADRISTA